MSSIADEEFEKIFETNRRSSFLESSFLLENDDSSLLSSKREPIQETTSLHKCPICDKTYLSNSALYRHKKRKHTESFQNLTKGRPTEVSS